MNSSPSRVLRTSSFALLAWLTQVPALDAPHLESGERRTLALTASDPVLAPRGRSQCVSYRASERSVVFVRAASAAIDPFVRVVDARGAELAADDDGGGGTTALTRVEAGAGDVLSICVASRAPDQIGSVEIVAVGVRALEEAEVARLAQARALVSEGDAAAKERKLDVARERLRAAIEVLIALERDGGALPPDVDLLLARAGKLAAECQDPRAATAAFRSLLRSRELVLPPEHAEVESAQLRLAHATLTLGEVALARDLFQAVLAVRERSLPSDHPDVSMLRANLGIALYRLGKLDAARELQQSVLEVYVRTLAPDDEELQRIKLNFAATLFALGDLPGSRAMVESVVAVRERTLPVDHPNLQAARSNLAATIAALGDLAGARALQESVLEIRARTFAADHPELQRARSNLALTRKLEGDLAGARALEEQVVEVLAKYVPEDNAELLLARANLASTIAEQGDLLTARALQEEILARVTRALPPEHPNVQRARLNLAATMTQQGELDAALKLHDEVLDVRARTLPGDHPDVQIARQSVASTLAALGARSQGAESESAEFRGYEQRFRELAAQFLVAQRNACRDALLDASGREAAERVVGARRLDVGLSMALGCGVFGRDQSLDEHAFLLSETTRDIALLSARIARAAGSRDEWEELQSRRSDASERLATIARVGGGAEEFERARAEIERVQREMVRLGRALDEDTMAALDLDIEDLARRTPPDAALIAYRRYVRSAYGPDGRLRTTPSLCAYIVRHERALARVELGPIAPIVVAVTSWRGDKNARADGEAARGLAAAALPPVASEALGATIRELVLDPLHEQVRGATRLVIAQDDVLHLVPFDALPAGALWPTRAGADERTAPSAAGDARMGDAITIEMRSSLLELVASDPPPHAGAVGVLVGAVDYERASDVADARAPLDTAARAADVASKRAAILRGSSLEHGFEALPGTRAEVRGIAQLCPVDAAVTMLEDADATRARLFALAPRARWLHVATHGWFAPESIRAWDDEALLDATSPRAARTASQSHITGMNPMLVCGLALAGANRAADVAGRVPGLLTAQELATLDLSQCELAVLSACDTNVGERRAGQGVASLQKALHMAGARSAITSLWKVPDAATKELMVDFYRRMWVEKKPKHRALWEAKTALREARDAHGKPLYTTRDWAAWVLTGDPD